MGRRLNELSEEDTPSPEDTYSDNEVSDPVAELKQRAERLLNEDTLDDDDRSEINGFLINLEVAVTDQNEAEVERLIAELEDILFFLEQ